ncbi:hypothetical protein QBC43DRAFT_311480 [Cladorrhinum sp. PSN259]|nr:hypothetical protein QBC43DRAFT_311480 [Cladorrhinum sp. PSN259]
MELHVYVILCTWSAQHPALPPKTNLKVSKMLRIWFAFWRKFKWMLFAIFAPESMAAKAIGDFVAAYVSSKCSNMAHHARLSETTWTRHHAFYANMGGYILEGPVGGHVKVAEASSTEEETTVQQNKPLAPSDHRRKHRWMEKEEWEDLDAFYEKLFQDPDEQHLLDFDFPFAVNSAQICILLDKGVVTRLPHLAPHEITEMGKEDIVIKLIALFQVLWLIIEVVARSIKGLQTTQLEIAALAFAACTIFTYLFLFEKPKDAIQRTYLQATRELTSTEKRQICLRHSELCFQDLIFFSIPGEWRRPATTIRNDVYNIESHLFCIGNSIRIHAEDVGLGLGGMIVGAVHCIAWNFPFPTYVEMLLWRICSLVSVGLTPAMYISWFCSRWFEDNVQEGMLGKLGALFKAVYFPAFYLLYVLSRLALLVLVFRSLVYSPSDAFTATWAASLPHIA